MPPKPGLGVFSGHTIAPPPPVFHTKAVLASLDTALSSISCFNPPYGFAYQQDRVQVLGLIIGIHHGAQFRAPPDLCCRPSVLRRWFFHLLKAKSSCLQSSAQTLFLPPVIQNHSSPPPCGWQKSPFFLGIPGHVCASSSRFLWLSKGSS